MNTLAVVCGVTILVILVTSMTIPDALRSHQYVNWFASLAAILATAYLTIAASAVAR